MLQTLSKPFKAVLDLVFPNLCAACEQSMPPELHCFCFSCQAQLPPSDMYKYKDNDFAKRMWGRVPFERAAAMFEFRKKTPIQKAIHKLKYENRPDIGQKLGRAFGAMLRKEKHFQEIDCIVPVPLQPKKLKIRGYNQSLQFALGLGDIMEKPIFANALRRNTHTKSQTTKARMDRIKTLSSVFEVQQPKLLRARHILLVDDVLTTGATLEHCGNAISLDASCKVSFATIAIAMH